jgi:hypothetical protein
MSEEKTLTIKNILMEDFGTNAVRDKLFLMDVKNRIHQDGNDFVRRILEDVNYINNGGRYDYALKQGEESKISSEAQEKAKEMVAILIPHVIQKAVAEIGAVVSLVKQNEEAPKQEEGPVEDKVAETISIRPASSYFNY